MADHLGVYMFLLQTVALAAAIATSSISAIPQSSQGWSYTQWGMSPEQVVAASNGAARLSVPPPPSSPRETGAVRAVGTMDGGAITFEVSFVFDRSYALTHVNLKAPPTECEPVLAELLRVYGRPYHNPRGGIAVQASWEDRQKNLHVSFIGSGVTCLVTYTPARRAVTGL